MPETVNYQHLFTSSQARKNARLATFASGPVVTGNPFIHFITLNVISVRVPFDTRMYIEIFRLK
jgi:hypothetical protein